MESNVSNGMTWGSVMNECFDDEALTKMKTCYVSKSEKLLQKVCRLFLLNFYC